MSYHQIAALLAFLVGIMSIVAGGKAMQGWNPGYSVLTWLPVYNFVMGLLALIPAILLWVNHRYTLAASVTTLGIHTLVLLLLLSNFRGEVAFQSIAAMIFRLAVWIVILGLVFFQARSTFSST